MIVVGYQTGNDAIESLRIVQADAHIAHRGMDSTLHTGLKVDDVLHLRHVVVGLLYRLLLDLATGIDVLNHIESL